MRARGGPLAGIRVLELTKVWAGPEVGKLFAYLGAEVIRVESEASLDVTRIYGVDDPDDSPGFQSVNQEKLSVRLNVKTPEGVALVLRLAERCDVLVENLRPGAVARLGLDYPRVAAVRPDIVYVSMGMYGAEGPLAHQTGYAPCFAALGGVSALVGEEGGVPEGINVRYGDATFGAAATLAALAALVHRARTGEGQFVDVSAVETMTSMVGDAVMAYTLKGEVASCDGNRHPEMAPHGVYPCAEGTWLALACADDAMWGRLAQAMGRPELAADPRYATLAARKARERELDQLIAAWTVPQPVDQLAARLQEAGVAATASASSLDLVADPLLWARGFFVEVTDGAGRTKTTTGAPWRMSRPARIERGAPLLGEHDDYVLGELLGLSEEERRALAARGVAR